MGVGSQQNENQISSGKHACGSDPNFTVEEFLRRVALVQEMAVIRCKHNGVFGLAAHHKHTATDHIRLHRNTAPSVDQRCARLREHGTRVTELSDILPHFSSRYPSANLHNLETQLPADH